MTVHASTVRDLPDALHDEGLFRERLAGRRPAVFLDYDGVLTPIVDRPEDAVISKGHAHHGVEAGPALHGARGQRPRPSRRPLKSAPARTGIRK